MIRSLTPKQKDELVNKLAELEHEQWCVWSKSIAPELSDLRNAAVVSNLHNDLLAERTTKRLERWNSYWVPFNELDEKTKEQDRKWVRKTLQIFEELNMEIVSK